MRGKAWTWFRWIIALWLVGTTSLSALSVPWRWTTAQCFFVFLCVCGAAVAGMWGWVWLRGGREAVTVALKRRSDALTTPQPKKTFYWNAAIWTAIALGLVVVFNLLEK